MSNFNQSSIPRFNFNDALQQNAKSVAVGFGADPAAMDDVDAAYLEAKRMMERFGLNGAGPASTIQVPGTPLQDYGTPAVPTSPFVLPNTIEELEALPEYRRLDLNGQASARAEWFQGRVAPSAVYQTQDFFQQQQTQAFFADRAPVPSSNDSRMRGLYALAKGLSRDDPQSVQDATGFYISEKAYESSLIVRGLVNIGAAVGKAVKAPGAQSLLDVVGELPPDIAADRAKLRSYILNRYQMNPTTSFVTGMANIGIPMADMVGTVVGGGAVVKGILGGVSLLPKLGGAASKTAEYLFGSHQVMGNAALRYFKGSLLPTLARTSAIDSPLLVMRDVANSNVSAILENRQPASPQFMELLSSYGANAAADIGFMSVLKILGSGLKLARTSFAAITDKAAPSDALMKSVISGKMDPSVAESLSPAQREAYSREMANIYSNSKLGEELTPNSPRSLELLAQKNGYSFTPHTSGKGFVLKSELDDSLPPTTVDSVESGTEVLLRKLAYGSVNKDGLALPNSTYSVRVTSQVTPEKASNVAIGRLQQLRPQLETGELKAASVKNIVYSAGRSVGLDTSKLDNSLNFRSVDEAEYTKALGSAPASDVLVPKTVTQSSTWDAFKSHLDAKLTTAANDLNSPEFSTLLRSSQEPSKFQSAAFNRTWVLTKTKELFGPDAKLDFNKTTGETKVMSGTTVLAQASSVRNLAMQYIQADNPWGTPGELLDAVRARSSELGLNLQVKTDPVESFHLLQNGKEIDASTDINQLLTNRPYLMPKLPSSSLPADGVAIDPLTGKLSTTIGVVTGSRDTVLDYLRGFKDTRKSILGATKSNLRSSGFNKENPIVVKSVNKERYDILLPEQNISWTFNSKVEAENFLHNTINENQTLLDVGLAKGFRLVPTQVGWTAQSLEDSTRILSFNSKEELNTWLKSRDSFAAESVPELSNLRDSLSQNLGPEWDDVVDQINSGPRIVTGHGLDVVEDVNKLTTRKWEGKGYRGRTTPLGLFQTTPDTIRDIAQGIGKAELSHKFDKLDRSFRAADSAAEAANEALRQIFHPVQKQLPLLRPFMESPPSAWEELSKKVGVELTPQLTKALTDYRQLMTTLGPRLGVDVFTLTSNYFPRVREALQKNLGTPGYDLSENAKDFLRRTLYNSGQALPKELDFFATHLRVMDLAHATSLSNPLESVEYYVRHGYRTAYTKDLYDDFKKVYGEINASGQLPKMAQTYVEDTLQSMFGGQDKPSITWVTDMSSRVLTTMQNFYKRLPAGVRKLVPGASEMVEKSAAQINDDASKLFTLTHSLTVAATQAWRPFLVLRNLMQVFQTTAPVLGWKYVSKALKEINPKTIHEDTEALLATGALKRNQSFLGQYEKKGALGAFNYYGMYMYQKADIVNRLITYKAALARWDEAFTNRVAGATDNPTFWLDTGASALHPMEQREIADLLKREGNDAARRLFGQKMVDRTQFTYAPHHNPLTMRAGVIGKIFGMFGHYSAGYVGMVRQALLNQPAAQALGFATRMAVSTAAFVAAYDKLFNFRSDSLTPWGQMWFTGGPHFDFASKVMEVINSPENLKPALLAQLRNDAATIFIPGSTLFRHWAKAIDSIERGDDGGALAHFLTAPYIDPK